MCQYRNTVLGVRQSIEQKIQQLSYPKTPEVDAYLAIIKQPKHPDRKAAALALKSIRSAEQEIGRASCRERV